MRGSKRETRPGVWELRVYVGRDPVTGRQRQRSRTFRGSARKAESALAALVAEAAEERSPNTSAPFARLLERWLEQCDRDLEATTVREYRRLARVHVVPALGSVPLDRLGADDLDALYTSLTAGGLGAGSVRQVHAVCRRALGQGVKWGWLPVNPAERATPPKLRRAEIVPPDVAALWSIVDHARRSSPRLAVLFTLAADTGARRGELVGLRWSDVDLEAGVAVIRHAVVDAGGHLVEKGTKTHAVRAVQLAPITVELLRAHLAEVEADAAVLEVEVDPLGYVFSHDPAGRRPLRPEFVSRTFARARDDAGVPSTVRLHDLRHLHASLLLAAGVPLPEVSARLGHAQTSTTLNVYAHLMPGARGASPDVVQRALARPKPSLDVKRDGSDHPGKRGKNGQGPA